MQTANESGLCPVCGQHFDSTAHMASCSTYVGEPRKKTEPETFQERSYADRMRESITAHYGPKEDYNAWIAWLHQFAREADQRIAQLTTDLAQCTESAPLELVELVEEFIQTLERYDDQEELVNRAKATIERWKV